MLRNIYIVLYVLIMIFTIIAVDLLFLGADFGND